MDNQNKGFGVIVICTLIVIIFWTVGGTLLALKCREIIQIDGGVIAAIFISPYALFAIACVVALVLLRIRGERGDRQRK